jgi:hypothetical protein
MKNIKHFTIIGIALASSLLIARIELLHFIPFVILGFFGFNILVRKIFAFRNYFTSIWNIFTSKTNYEKEFEFSADLLMPKLIEVINESEFSIVEVDSNGKSIFVTSSMSWFSWGENIYIDVIEVNSKGVMKLCSVGFFQMYSFGKNNENYENLISNFNASLVI